VVCTGSVREQTCLPMSTRSATWRPAYASTWCVPLQHNNMGRKETPTGTRVPVIMVAHGTLPPTWLACFVTTFIVSAAAGSGQATAFFPSCPVYPGGSTGIPASLPPGPLPATLAAGTDTCVVTELTAVS